MGDPQKDKPSPAALKVKYKSATVDEFIRQSNKDISLVGIFIKTKAPMEEGVPLKFELQLEDGTPIIRGIGHVAWRRQVAQSDDRPSGMGIKFLKLDSASRQVIDQAVKWRGSAPSRFDRLGEAVAREYIESGRPLHKRVSSSPAVTHAAVPPGAEKTPGQKSTTTDSQSRFIAPSRPEVPPEPAKDLPVEPPKREIPQELLEERVIPSSKPPERPELEEAVTSPSLKPAGERDIQPPLVFNQPPPPPEVESFPLPGREAEPAADERVKALEKELFSDLTGDFEKIDSPLPPAGSLADLVPTVRPPAMLNDIPVAGTGLSSREHAGPGGEPQSKEARPSYLAKGVLGYSAPDDRLEQAETARKEKAALKPAAAAPYTPEEKGQLPASESDIGHDSIPLPLERPKKRNIIAPFIPSRNVSNPPVPISRLFPEAQASVPPVPIAVLGQQPEQAPASAPATAPSSAPPPEAPLPESPSFRAPRLAEAEASIRSLFPRAKSRSRAIYVEAEASIRSILPRAKAQPIWFYGIGAVAACAAIGLAAFLLSNKEDKQTTADIKPTAAQTERTTKASTEAPQQQRSAASDKATAAAVGAQSAQQPKRAEQSAPAVPTVEVPINSTPSPAAVTVNGIPSGQTPAKVPLPIGKAVTVEVKAPGYAQMAQQATGRPDHPPLSFKLVPLPFQLTVNCEPIGAMVITQGRTHIAPAVINLEKVTGPFYVIVAKTGHKKQVIQLKPEQFVEREGMMRGEISATLTPVSSSSSAKAEAPKRPTAPPTAPTAPRQPVVLLKTEPETPKKPSTSAVTEAPKPAAPAAETQTKVPSASEMPPNPYSAKPTAPKKAKKVDLPENPF